jgi:TetR/AcrR family transcriptional regulator of autoinduction and epiphytic fitness
MDAQTNSDGAISKVQRGGSREAIVEAAARLFLQRGFGSVSMDELAEAAGVARRTLYNQFARKEEIFREMLLRVSGQLEDAFPPGIETRGDVEEVLRVLAGVILDLHKNPKYLGFLRMVVADSRQFPWIAEEFAAVMDPQTGRLIRYLDHLNSMGILDCRNPTLAAHQFMGMLNEFSLWPWMMGREGVPVSGEDVVEETIRIFLSHYRRPRSDGRGDEAKPNAGDPSSRRRPPRARSV